MKPPKGYKPEPVKLFARPRDTDERNRKPGERTLETYRLTKEWVVECFDSCGNWLWTYFGPKPLSQRRAKDLAKNWVPKTV
jgi:hypothetical protein